MNPTQTTEASGKSDVSAPPSNLVLFVCLLGASFVATVAQTPALLFLSDPARVNLFVADESMDPITLVVVMGVANVVLSAVAIAIGLCLEPSVRMGVPLLRSWLAIGGGALRPMFPALLRCLVFSFSVTTVFLACGLVLRSQLPELPDNFVFPPIWQGILMMLGASVREEILFRFFALNLFTWIAMKMLRRQKPTTAIIWVTNVLAAILFASLHVPPVAQVLDLKPIAIGVGIALAAVAGVLLGWVYWRHGLLMAMFTHAVAGILLYLGVRGLMAFTA